MNKYIYIVAMSLVIGLAGCAEMQAKGGSWATQSDIEALKADQAALRKDLEEVKKQLASKKKQRQQVSDVNHIMNVSADPYKGSKTARLTMVEYTDYQCPYCARHSKSVLPQFIKNYVDTGKVRYVLRDFPLSFHKNATKAAYAAHCAGDQDKYWEMHDKLFENQRALDEAKLPEYAKAVGLDVGKFNACLTSGSHKGHVDANTSDGRKAGVKGTPSFVLGFTQGDSNEVKGEKLIRGAVGYNVFQKAVDEMLAKKK